MRLWIYASVVEHDYQLRQHLLEELRTLQIMPAIHGDDKVEFRYYGERETVLELGQLCEAHIFHSINIWGG